MAGWPSIVAVAVCDRAPSMRPLHARQRAFAVEGGNAVGTQLTETHGEAEAAAAAEPASQTRIA